MPEIANQTCLITGAASGIGAATATLLADRGIGRLILVDLNEEALSAMDLPCAIQRFGGDVSDPRLWDRIAIEAQPITHAVFCAGIADSAPIAEIDIADWRRLMTINLDGLMLSLRCAIRAMRDEGGSIVVVGSAAGVKPEPGTAAYGSSKAAAHHLVKVAAKEGAPFGIRVNAIAPGGVDTPIWDQVPFFTDLVARHKGDRAAAMAELGALATPLGRYATAREVAGQIDFLLFEQAATITGTILLSDGGYTV